MDFPVGLLCVRMFASFVWSSTVNSPETNCSQELSDAIKEEGLRDVCREECCQLDLSLFTGNEVWRGFCVGYRLLLLRLEGEAGPGSGQTYARLDGNACALHEFDDDAISEPEMHCLGQLKKIRRCKREREKTGRNRWRGTDDGNEEGIDFTSERENVIPENHPPNPRAEGGFTKKVDCPQDDKNWLPSPSHLHAPKSFSSPSQSSLVLRGLSVQPLDWTFEERVGEEGRSFFLSENWPTSGGTNPSQQEYHQSHEAKVSFSWSPCTFYESFFNDSCYSLEVVRHPRERGNNTEKPFSVSQKILHDLSANALKTCRLRPSTAFGLAVETKKENRFVMDVIKNRNLFPNALVLTSGILSEGASRGRWQDWNLQIDDAVIDVKSSSPAEAKLYAINSGSLIWQLLNLTAILSLNSNVEWLVMCKRSHNFRNIQPHLYEQCLKEYRVSKCYNSYKFVNYCCAVDEKGELWFGCPKEIQVKETSMGVDCAWYCGDDGLFVQEYPICRKGASCEGIHNKVKYMAAAGRHAIGSCPPGFFGYSTWYCAYNRTFLGKPSYKCCKNHEMCKAIDSYLNIWMSCPDEKAKKRVLCPLETLLTTATVEWYCSDNLKFSGSSPDYAKCNETSTMCVQRDKHGRKWKAAGGTVVRKTCPGSTEKKCFWKCNKSGQFETLEPDCSKCLASWTKNVTQHIRNGTHYSVVMEIIENHTRIEDLTMGFSEVLDLTSAWVDLYEDQTSPNETQFNHFLVGYSKILKNVAGKLDIWSTFLASNRREYARQIIEISQKAAFSYLSSPPLYRSGASYNATLADFDSDGFDFFVLYGNNPSNVTFPLENPNKKDWRLEIKDVNRTHSSFATMGLVMNHSLSHLMFPTGNATASLVMNSPAITLTVAALDGNETALVPNVSVFVTFKHFNKTRLPASRIVRRRLHEGETPSGVFGSTICRYFRYTEWSNDGCSVTRVSEEETQCTCPHLSTIGLLMSVHHYEPDNVLEIISVVSSVVSIIALVLTLVAFLSFDSIKNDRILIGVNLCGCLIVGHFLLVTVMDKRFFYIPDDMCPVYAVLIHYVFMAAFAWMFLEACHLYRMLVLVFESHIEFRCIYVIIGYGLPGLIIGLTELVGLGYQEQPYGEDELCWLKTPNYVWAFIGPVIFLTSINFIVLIIAMKLAITSKVKTERSYFYNLRIWIKGCFSLSALLGITWLFGLAYVYYNDFLAYTFVILNGLQGLFIFIFRVVCNKQYKSAFIRMLRSFFAVGDDFGSFKKPDHARSGTKLFVVTQTGSKVSGVEVDSGLTLSRDGSYFNSFLSKCLRRSLFKSHASGSDREKPREEETSSGIGLEYEEGSEVSVSQSGTLRKRVLKTEAEGEDRGPGEKDWSQWFDPNDFPELSYHTNHYRL